MRPFGRLWPCGRRYSHRRLVGWKHRIEQPLFHQVVAGLGPGLAGVKLFAVGLGISLHLCRVHNLLALLTTIYIAGAILPLTQADWALEGFIAYEYLYPF